MSTLPPFQEVSALVVGDLMLDQYWHGPARRISPEAPVPVVQVNATEMRPGGAANVALNLRHLGCTTHLCGIVGEDDAGRTLSDRLAQESISSHLVYGVAPTVVKLRVLSQHQQLIRLDFETPHHDSDLERLSEHFRRSLDAASIVVFSDYAKGALQQVELLIAAARERGVPVLVDPKGSDFSRYRGATLITPNRRELEAVVGDTGDLDGLFQRADRLRRQLDIEAIVVTLSEDGMALISGNGVVHIPTDAREVFDVTGAGDTVIGTLAAAIGAGADYETAIRLANKAAGIAVGKLGTATVSVDELQNALLSEQVGINAGIVSESELLERVEVSRSAGNRIVFTNGCFDLLHPGHVRYLEQAAALGDRLVVAVNGDDSVRQLKGPARPINTLPDRMAMLAALRSVDWVVSFDEETPERLIDTVRPDVLVKGGDYRPDEIAGARSVTENGGRVVIMDFVDGFSSTSLIERIKSISPPE